MANKPEWHLALCCLLTVTGGGVELMQLSLHPSCAHTHTYTKNLISMATHGYRIDHFSQAGFAYSFLPQICIFTKLFLLQFEIYSIIIWASSWAAEGYFYFLLPHPLICVKWIIWLHIYTLLMKHCGGNADVDVLTVWLSSVMALHKSRKWLTRFLGDLHMFTIGLRDMGKMLYHNSWRHNMFVSANQMLPKQ